MALIRANRESIDDRFSVLGFTVRTETPLFEIGLATDPELLKAENRARRTSRNFFSTHLLRAQQRREGETVYLVPPNVVARFAGQSRLYFGLATYQEKERTVPVTVRVPDRGHMYVSLSGLTARGLRRTARLDAGSSYGNGTAGAELQWGGDALVPVATTPSGNGNGTAAAPSEPTPYSDGYSEELWRQNAANAAPAPGPAPVASGPESPAVAQSYAYAQGNAPRMPARPLARPLLVGPHNQPSDWWDALTTQIGHFARGAMWFLGVADTTRPPYSAICQVRRPDGSEEGAHVGTAFFIGPRLLLTAGHVVDGESELIIVPGKNGGGVSAQTEPFGRFSVSAASFRKHPAYGSSGRDNDMALICVPEANAATGANYFALVEELTQSRPEGVVVSGYAAWWYATSAIEEFVNANIDHNRQHAHGGHIREIPTDGTFSYDLQTLAGTSGSPVYWIEEGAQPRAHLVGVHVASHDNTTNLGCRITQEKLRWIRDTATQWGQSLSFALGARSLQHASAEVDPDAFGITEDEPVEAEYAMTQSRARALDAPVPDYPGASRFEPAHPNNYMRGRRPDRIVDRVVIHITAGGPSINGTIAWFQNGDRPNRSSAHYIVGRDGEVVQMVRNADTAWHASSANSRSIGIEHNVNKPSHRNRRDLPPTVEQYEASARLVAWLCQQYNLPADREHIRGHQEMSPGDNHECPSSYWDWDTYMACVQQAVAALSGGATAQAFAGRRIATRALEDASGHFVWPGGTPDNSLVKLFVDAYNARIDAGVLGEPPGDPTQFRVETADDRARAETLRNFIPQLASWLDSDSGRQYVSHAILGLTTAVSAQALDLIKDRLPPGLTLIVTDPNDLPTGNISLPRNLQYVSARIGMFMAWLDVAIQQAAAGTAERLRQQKAEWDGMRSAAGLMTTVVGNLPGLGIVTSVLDVVLDKALDEFAPNFDRQYGSFVAAMDAVRQAYRGLASKLLLGMIQGRYQGANYMPLDERFVHPDIQALLDAHAANALLGWERELAFLGVNTTILAQGQGARGPLSRAQEIITPFYDPADPATALTCQADAFSLAREEWFTGVPSTTLFPHSAICQLNMTGPDGSRYSGTGFYIGTNRILTCAHNLQGMVRCEIIPGRNGAGTRPFGSTAVTSASWRVAPRYSGSGDWDNDLAVIDNVPLAAPGGNYFEFLNATPSTQLPVVVCGYSAASRKVPQLDYIIDGDKQHLHGGYVSQAPTADTIDYPILSLMGASGSPVYTLTGTGSDVRARICAVHVSGEPAAQGLNRGCFITPAKIDWIEARATSFGLAYRARGLGEEIDEDSAHGIEGPIPDDVAFAQSLATLGRALNTPAPEYPQASRFVPAANGNYRVSASARSIERIVIHITDGGANINGTIGWFQNPAAKVSAHYVIGQDGEVVQMVKHNDVAWHAGSANRTGIGIEHVANTRGLRPTPAQLAASAALVTWLCDCYGIPADRTHVLGHAEADPRTTHTACPNAVWDWDYYMGLVNSRSSYAPDAATAQALGARRARSRALEGGADYPVQLIPQPDKNSCWAASMAMLLSFRRNQSLTPESLANDVGASLAGSYNWDLLKAVRDRYGFEMIRQPDNTSLYHSPQQWADWLSAYGPLWVVIVGAPHAVVLAGIRGNLADPASVEVKILNPWDTRVAFDNDPLAFRPGNGGYEDWLSFNQFASDFGNMAEASYGNWRVLHLPATATTAQSLADTGGYNRVRLAQPPAPIRALDLGEAGGAMATAPAETLEPVEPARVAGTRMSVLRGTAGACTWALDQLDGLKFAAPLQPVAGVATHVETSIELGDWPAIDGAPCPLPLTIGFSGSQRHIGDVAIHAGAPAQLAYGVDVAARIEDGTDVGGVPSLKVTIEYRFRGLAQGNPAARIELRLLGDGRFERENRWLEAGAAIGSAGSDAAKQAA